VKQSTLHLTLLASAAPAPQPPPPLPFPAGGSDAAPSSWAHAGAVAADLLASIADKAVRRETKQAG
jgi:hypothetical protein